MVFVLSSLLLISIVGIITLLSYKIVRITGGGEVNTSGGVSADILKNKLVHLFEHTHRKGAHFVFSRGRDVYNKAGKHVSGRYTVFADAMNGKGDISKKGAASFFLKSVSEHKRKMRGERE
jgi:hypothetical protein